VIIVMEQSDNEAESITREEAELKLNTRYYVLS